MTRVYLYSEEPILATGLEALLAATGRFRLDTFAGIPRLLACLEADVPDILLLDFTPGVTFGVLSNIRLAARECKLVLWVDTISVELAFQAMGLGVRGILRKTLPTELQVKCLCKVQDGELWFEKALADGILAARQVVLSRREGQLVTLLSYGLSNKEIASTLLISEGTVKVYLSRLFQKAGVKDRCELGLAGLKNLTAGQSRIGETPGRAGGPPTANLRKLVLKR